MLYWLLVSAITAIVRPLFHSNFKNGWLHILPKIKFQKSWLHIVRKIKFQKSLVTYSV
jgi:hypothetical protein